LACNHHDDPSCSAHAYSLQSAPPCFPVNSIINASLVILCILFFVCSPRPNNRPVSRSFLVLFVFRVATRFRLHPNSIMVLFAATDEPLIDEDNPLYCPDVSAQQVYFHIHWSSKPTFISIQFLSSVRLFQASVSDSTRFSFYQRLCSVFDDSESKESPSGCSLGVIRSSQTPESIHHAPLHVPARPVRLYARVLGSVDSQIRFQLRLAKHRTRAWIVHQRLLQLYGVRIMQICQK
jgi:hypothetical protein